MGNSSLKRPSSKDHHWWSFSFFATIIPCFPTTDHPYIPIQYLPIAASIAVREGLSEEEALKAITINPARNLGVDKRVGSIEIGKDADLVL